MKESFGFIGDGRFVRILLHGWMDAGVLPENLIVSDPNRGALEQIAREFPGVQVVQDGNALAAGQDLPPEQVMDLVPVRPRSEDELAIREMYRKRLPALYQKPKA